MPWRIEPRSYDDPAAAGLIEALQGYYGQLYGAPDDTRIDVAEFDPPHGLFLVAFGGDGSAVGSGGWRRHEGDPGVVEIKRMYVAPSARGHGLARALVGSLERTARRAGARRAVLLTGEPQSAAIALYRACGYVPAERFGHYADAVRYPDALFFAKDLIAE